MNQGAAAGERIQRFQVPIESSESCHAAEGHTTDCELGFSHISEDGPVTRADALNHRRRGEFPIMAHTS